VARAAAVPQGKRKPIAFDLDGRVDSIKGRLRTRIETVPDAPLKKAIITLQGAKKGPLPKLDQHLQGHLPRRLQFQRADGKIYDTKPAVKANCPKKGKR
jgi:hypothetical protein